MFPFARYVHLFPPSLQWVPWPLLAEALRFPTFAGNYGVVRLLIPPCAITSGFPWRPRFRSCEQRCELSWVPGESFWKHAPS
jgi:hypothetical protein